MKIKQLRDVNNSIYYGISEFRDLNSDDFLYMDNNHLSELYFTFLAKCKDWNLYELNKQYRDGEESHITVFSVADVGFIIKKLGEVAAASYFENLVNINVNDLTFEGIGTSSKDGNETYYIVCKSYTLNATRNHLGMANKDYHITLGFNKKDVFGVDKSIVKYTINDVTLKEKFKVLDEINNTAEYLSNLNKWPNIDGEPVDTENLDFVSIDDDTVIIVAGGDWQEPTIIKIKNINNELTITDSYKSDDYPNILSYDDIVKILDIKED